ncbi:hypothetical protein GCM10007387_47190 [Pseudoduganella albidiflava]|uniref:Uncharacterized protein n=1 Tax=Pseudoduganella albidiflava TaxID=321983 RepID=A0AA88C543_9BURK|nr:hypothetical protein GCM10007387_47190 [Pseudoduganella albidiflava]
MNHGLCSVKGARRMGLYFAALTKQACLDSNAGLWREEKCWNKWTASHAAAAYLFS